MKKSIYVFLTLLILLVACDRSGQDVVVFSVFGDPPEFQAYEELVAVFEEQNPTIDVELIHVPGQSDYRRRLAADFSAGSPPDIFLLNYRRFATFAEQGGLEPLTPYVADSELIDPTDFYPIAIDSFTMDDDLWCVPQNISSLVVYYNKDLFDAAGVAYPSDDWNREDFLAAARALTQDNDGDGTTDQYGVGIEPSIFRLAPFVWQDGGDIVDNFANPTRLTLDDPHVLETFQWFVDLQLVEGVVPSALAESAEESESRFLNGTLGMFFNSRRAVPTFRTIDGFDWDVAPLPRGQKAAGILHSDGYCMAQRTDNKAAAWKFIEFANSFEGQSVIVASGRTVPSRIAVAESDAFLDPSERPANSRVFVDFVDQLGRVPLMTTWISIEETAGKEIERAFYGDATVQEAAAAAIENTQTYFDNR